MTTTAEPASAPHDHYPDDVLGPRNSPELRALHPNLIPSPSPPPVLPPGLRSPSPKSRRKRSRRHKVRPNQGDAVLLNQLDGGRNPDISRTALLKALPSDPDDESDESCTESSDTDSTRPSSTAEHPVGLSHGARVQRQTSTTPVSMPIDTGMPLPNGAIFDLKSLAAGALARADHEPRSDDDLSEDEVLDAPGQPSENGLPGTSTLSLAARRDVQMSRNPMLIGTAAQVASPFGSPSISSPNDQSNGIARLGLNSPPVNLWPDRVAEMNRKQELPPINSPSSEGEADAGPLPPLRIQLGNIKELSYEIARDAEIAQRRRGNYIGQADMGPASIGKYSMAPGRIGSPPDSPHGRVPIIRRAGFASPDRSVPSEPSRFYQPIVHRYHGYASSTTGETPGTDQSGSTPATDSSLGTGMENTQAIGLYVCRYQGCTAMPFQTQYLLNSHANVHSLSRPHYCPVKGCSRSEGGRGFKRKNEMIRHGLVHESPGYVCPFCPDREHKYPRPDNLQRHVRVHHVDKDKDDPALRDVLAQRPDGPSRGRRRRGAPV